jgi:ELWxxDGT repeat protein
MLPSAWLAPIRHRLQELWQHRRTAARRGRPRGRLRLEALEDRTVLSASLVADLNQQPVDSNPHNLVNLDGTLYFTANDSIHGNQLWKSDGTADGTVMVTDINPTARAGFDPGNLTVVGHTLYFSANDGTHGVELWKSDGTTDGTALVKDLVADTGSSYPGSLTNVNGTLYFVTNTATGQNSRLYKSDGTADGTVEIAGNYPGQIRSMAAAGDGLYFFTNNPNGINFYSSILWKTNGGAAQQLTTAEQPSSVTAVNNALFYADYLPGRSVPFQLRRTDSTGSVTLGSYGPYGGAAVSYHGAYYFSDSLTYALWKSDGTAAGTTRVANFTQFGTPLSFVTFADTLYFTANNGTGAGLWKSDGTAAGTVRVTDSSAGLSFPRQLVAADGELYFQDVDDTHGYSVWKSDGTAAGTARVADVLPNRFNWSVSSFTGVGGAVYFVIDKATGDRPFDLVHNRQLWKSDGTADGTALVKAINTATVSALPHDLFNFNGSLYFTADDGVHGDQLYTTDGTAAGTVMLTNVPGGTRPHDPVSFNGKLYFTAGGSAGEVLWQTDGTPAGTTAIAGAPGGRYLRVFNGAIYYAGYQPNHGYQLFKSDGTAAGTVRITDFATQSFFGLDPSEITVFNNALYFSATDGPQAHGYQLWKSDGTAAGTVRITSVNPSRFGGLGFSQIIVADGLMLFAGNDGVHGQELWASDGTAAGTRMVADISPGAASSNPANLTVVNGVVYFTADDGAHGTELWKVGAVTAGFRTVVSPTATAGGAFTVTVQALNDFGGVDPNYRGTVHFTSSDGLASLPADYTFTADDAGSHAFTGVTLFRAGSQTLTIADLLNAGLTDTVSVLVRAASVASFNVAAPDPAIMNEPFDLTVTALDAYGNEVTDYQGTVSLQGFGISTDLPASYTFTSDDAGSHTFSVTADRQGFLLVTVTDSVANASGSVDVRVKRKN